MPECIDYNPPLTGQYNLNSFKHPHLKSKKR